MNRLYRGKTKDGKWVYGCLMVYTQDGFPRAKICRSDHDATDDYDPMELIPVIPETVGQQVGKKDRNNKEAYAGDMVTAYTYSNWVIDWHDAGWKLKQDTIDHWTEIPKDFIIFSNIHQKK